MLWETNNLLTLLFYDAKIPIPYQTSDTEGESNFPLFRPLNKDH